MLYQDDEWFARHFCMATLHQHARGRGAAGIDTGAVTEDGDRCLVVAPSAFAWTCTAPMVSDAIHVSRSAPGGRIFSGTGGRRSPRP